MYVPAGPGELPRIGLRVWTAVVVLLAAVLVKLSVEIVQVIPKLENTTAARIEYFGDRAQLLRGVAVAALGAALASHLMAWRNDSRTSLVLFILALSLLGGAVVGIAVTF
jgi:hypothetical protein